MDQMEDSDIKRIPLQLSRGYVVASIQIDLSDAVLRQFRKDLLTFIQSSGATGLILELSGVDIIDLEDFESLRKTMTMAAIMGARPVVAGVQPGVVSALVELDANIDGIDAALDLDDAFNLMEKLHAVDTTPFSEEEEVSFQDDS